MKQSVLNLQNKIAETLGSDVLTSEICFDELTIELSSSAALSAFQILKDTLGFEQLIDLWWV